MLASVSPPPPVPAASDAANTSRLVVHKIVLQDFKSYAGRQEIGPFHQSFSSIVGPNGSGKSNVIDAIMFVLGYRAKKMRQAKLSDLIHTSEHLTEIESCTVEVHFERIIQSVTHRPSPADTMIQDDVLQPHAVPGCSLVVARTAYRNNRNVYTLNGVASSFTEITTLLREQGIDLDHKRFLILQGEVEAIAMMKPKASTEHEEGLLEYLEDIIGTNAYIELIDLTGKELDAVHELHSEKLFRVRVAEKERSSLHAEKEEAEAFLRQENTLVERRSELLQVTKWQGHQELQKATERIAANSAQLQSERDRHAEDAATADQLDSQIQALTKEATTVEARIKALQSDQSALEKEDIKLQETRKHLKAKLKAVSKHSIDTNKQQKDISRSIESVSSNIGNLQADLEQKRLSLTKASSELDQISSSLKHVTAKFHQSLEESQERLVPFQERLRNEQQACDLAKATLAAIEAKVQAAQQEQASASDRLERVRGELRDSTSKKTSLEIAQAELRGKTDQTRSSIEKMEAARANLAKQVQSVQSTISEATALLAQSESGGPVYKALIKESKAGRIKGINGRLGDLGAIDKKYDIAIATACSFLDHIVVDNTQTGQGCIEFLRTNNVGRANFIILEKMKPAQTAKPRDLPSGAQRLFDLVKIKDPRHTDAMYFALNETLVAESLQEAQSWAYGAKRWRVVTIDGKLYETSGTVSGGGQVRRGGMSAQFKSEVSEEEVRLLQEKQRELQAELNSLSTSLSLETSRMAELEERMMRVEAEESLISGLIKSLPTEIEILEKNLAESKDALTRSLNKQDQAEMKRQREKIVQCEKDLEQCRQEMLPIEAIISQIQQDILNAGGIKYKVQKSKVESLKDQITAGERRCIELGQEHAALERQLSVLESGGRDEEQLARIEQEVSEIDKVLGEATSKALEIQKKLVEQQLALEEHKDRLKELTESFEKASKNAAKFRKLDYDLRCAIESDEEKVLECQRSLLSCDAELGQLKLNQIDPAQAKPELAIYDAEELAGLAKDLKQIKLAIEMISGRLERSRPNLKVLEQYRIKEQAFNELKSELDGIEGRRGEIREKYEELCRRRLDEFMVGFRLISAKLKEMYQLITMGGNAELELVDSLDPFAEGVLFSVMPPRKSWKNISNLSGGEKTLSSLALVFALHSYKPTPIYVMDEIDAALDFRNVSIIAHYIKERTKDAQFIVISLRNNMFELADRLIGIYKTWQRTKSVTVDPRMYEGLIVVAPPIAN